MTSNQIIKQPPAPLIPATAPTMVATSPVLIPQNSSSLNHRGTRRYVHIRRPLANSTLTAKLVGDVLVGSAVTFTIVPFLTVVDKAIVQKATNPNLSLITSGYASLINMVKHPVAYVKSPTFLLMWCVYAATYSTANSLKSISERNANKSSSSAASSSDQMSIFMGTSLVNSTASLWKDQAYAKMFGTASHRPVPITSLGLWATRDFLVVASAFILPDIVAAHLADKYEYNRADAQKMAQLCLPIATQLIAGPIQLLGLDLYNRPHAAGDRVRFLQQGFTSVVSARVARIAPGYGIGGVLNTHFRDEWRRAFVTRP